MLKRVGTLLWLSFAVGLVALALALSSARLLLPSMAGYKGELEDAASRLLGREVHIGALDAGWRGLSPVLALKQVHISGDEFAGGRLPIGKIQIALDLWRSLLQRHWQSRGVYLIGTQLRLRRDRQGRVSLAGPAEATTQTVVLPALLLRQPLIGFQDVRITLLDEAEGGITRVFRDVKLLLANDGDRHRFSLQAALPPSLGARLELAGRLHGAGNDPGAWNGRLYLRADDWRLRQWLEFLPSAPPASGHVDAQIWADLSAGRLERLSGTLRGHQITVDEHAQQATPFAASRLGGRFDWRRTPEGWRLSADRVELVTPGAAPAPAIALGVQWQAAGRHLRGAVSYVPVEPLNALLPRLPMIGPKATVMLERLRPAGELRDVEFDWQTPASRPPRFSARARFRNLAIRPAGGLPGISGLAGSIEGNLLAGKLRLDTTDAVLSAPKLLRSPLAFTHLNGGVSWHRFGDRFRLQADKLQARTRDTGLAARLQLDWPDQQAAPWLDMQVDLQALPLPRVPDYLPVGVMSPKTVAWLDQALKSGLASHGRLILQGRTDQLPFDHGEGVLAADFDFSDTLLAFNPRWGPIDALEGHAHFSGRSIRVDGDRGRILQSTVERVVARIDDVTRPLLKVTGTADGTLAGMLEYVRTSPLGERFGRLASEVDAAGNAHLTLDLTLPLKPGLGTVQVAGNVALDGNELIGRRWGFDLSDIHGSLQFSERGLSCEGVKAAFGGTPVEVSIYPDKDAATPATVIDIEGRLGVVRRLKQAGWWPAEHIEGGAGWRARLYIPNRNVPDRPPLRLRLQSNLRGIRLDLPAPFDKSAEQARDFWIEWVPGSAADWPLRMAYAGVAKAVLKLAGQAGGLYAAGLHFGDGEAVLPERRELRITGSLARAAPTAWAAVFKAGAESGTSRLPPLAFDLELGALDIRGRRVESVRVTSQPSRPWDIGFTGSGAEGRLRLGFGEDKRLQWIDADFSHLVVLSGASAQATGEAGDAVRPTAFPALKLAIGDLNWDGRALGIVAVEATQAPDGLRFPRVSLVSDALTMEAQGEWREADGRQLTRLSGDLQDGELGELLRLAGDHGSVDGGQLQGGFDFTWPGSPADFALERLEGELSLRVKQGRFVDVKPGAGKLLGLLNLQSLPRRLFLDFSDLFKQGFSFDRMKGTFLLVDGDAYTNDLRIEGPSADIEIAGRTDLVNQEYDELVTVIPHLTGGLPVAGAIAGGPAVGAAVLLAERLFGKHLDELNKVQYQVTGSWTDPVYQRLKRNGNGVSTGPAKGRRNN